MRDHITLRDDSLELVRLVIQGDLLLDSDVLKAGRARLTITSRHVETVDNAQ